MNELTLLMNEYRLCLRAIWNTFLAAKGGFDERDYFYNASIELFKAIVLFSLEEDRNIEILPAYRGDKKSFMPIRVIALNPEGVLVSKSGEFHDTQSLDSDIQLNKIDSRYIDLYDFNELSFREFKYVNAEIIASPIVEQIGYRLLIPFESVRFENS